MNEPLHPAQVEAIEKLKGLRVGALYMERQEGKLRTVVELVRHRLGRGRIDGVLWLCTRRRVELLDTGIARHAQGEASHIRVLGIETLSHNLGLFLDLMAWANRERLMLVIDNGLLIKNAAALRTQRVIALSQRCPYRLLISDVPLARNAADMFAQWYALDWRILGYQTYWGFCMNHLGSRGQGRHMAYLLRAIAPYCAQILREEVQAVACRKEYVWLFRLPPQAMAEYRRVQDAFLWKALYSSTGVYRMLQACQHVVCGRRVTRDYPLQTEPLYSSPAQDPRLLALLEVLERTGTGGALILCRYTHECETVAEALARRYGEASVTRYPTSLHRRFAVMNIFADEREEARLAAPAIIYYSSDWNWRKRQEKERQCQNALGGGALTVISLAAADTLDTQILKTIWNKDNLVKALRSKLAKGSDSQGAET